MFALPLSASVVAALTPVRVASPPRIDGHLDDAAWTAVPASDAFTQSFPDDAARPNEPTRVQVAYDDDNLYIAIDCTQAARRLARLTRRDRDVDDDRVSVDIDTAHDRRSAFHFQVSAAGVLVDGLRYGDTELNTDWDEIWQGEAAATATGWSAELAIPLRILRVHPGVATWGLQIRRWTGATGELDTFAWAPRDAGGEVSRYGEVGPFDGLAPRQSIALVPFGLTRAVRTDPTMPSQFGDGMSAAAGLDATWRPRPDVVVSAAALPDFAQVEADQVVINLTTTEIEYPEKRPFFLQGTDVFQTAIQQVYTRRIGADAPVLGAAKVLASTGSVELAALSAVTDATPTAAAASDHVVRARITGDGATLGVLGTATHAAHDAYTGGLDAAWRSGEGTWTASGQVVGSHIDGGLPMTRRDGTVIGSGDGGIGSELRVAKEGGAYRAELSYGGYSRRFDVDDLGYLARANVQRVELDLEGYSTEAHGPMLETRSRIEIYQRRNLEGLALPSGYQWNLSGTTKGLWHAFVELHYRPSYFDDRELGDGRALERSGRLGLELSLTSDPHRAVSGGLSLATRATHDGGETYANGVISVRPHDNLELAAEPDLIVARGEPRFVDGSDAMVPRFARLDATSFGVTTRATWTLHRDLTIQAYVQALLATLHHRDAFVADPAAHVLALDDLHPAAFDPAMYDTREGALNATVVGRWEYAPGSTAYVVYSHAQVPAADRATFDVAALSRGPAQDVILVKLSWAWLR